jgi:hypothetical protein
MDQSFRKFPLKDIVTPNDLSQALEYLLRILPERAGDEMPKNVKEEHLRVMAMIQAYKNKDILDRLLGECGILPPE